MRLSLLLSCSNVGMSTDVEDREGFEESPAAPELPEGPRCE